MAKTLFRPGEAVFVHISTQRSLPCFASIHQRVVSFEGGDRNRPTVWQDYRDSHGWTNAGTFDSDYYFLTPDKIPPGHYFYERSATYECENVDTVHQEQPLIPFEIAGT
jgi:hypothetical protein